MLAILNPKGGVGKTTLATNLACCLHHREYPVLLLDADPQGSARAWYAAAPSDIALPPVVASDRPGIDKVIASLGSSYAYIVIDGPARLESFTASAIRTADYVLIPIRPSGVDVWAVASLLEAVAARQQVTGGMPVALFIVSSQISGSLLSRELPAALSSFGIPVLLSRTTHRVAYAEALGLGVSVIDLAGRSKAAAEIHTLTDELLRFIHGKD